MCVSSICAPSLCTVLHKDYQDHSFWNPHVVAVGTFKNCFNIFDCRITLIGFKSFIEYFKQILSQNNVSLSETSGVDCCVVSCLMLDDGFQAGSWTAILGVLPIHGCMVHRQMCWEGVSIPGVYLTIATRFLQSIWKMYLWIYCSAAFSSQCFPLFWELTIE